MSCSVRCCKKPKTVSSCSQNKTCHLVSVGFLTLVQIPVQCCRPVSFCAPLQPHQVVSSSVVPSFLHLHGFHLHVSCPFSLHMILHILCFLKSFSSSAARSAGLQEDFPILPVTISFIFCTVLSTLQFSTCSGFSRSHLQAVSTTEV